MSWCGGRKIWVKLKENDHLEDLGVVGRILELTLVELVLVGVGGKVISLNQALVTIYTFTALGILFL